MKKNLRTLVGAAVGVVASLSFTSCYYDPYSSSASVGGSYSSGYGDGYGYGGSGFSTSLFVSTGDPRWGYDPNCYSYYDYHRRCYYDPYLNGYYPVGYRPPVVYGVPHPYGWHRGGGYIRPPVRVTNVTVTNYRNRASLYQNTKYGWAKQVRQQPAGSGRPVDSHPSQVRGIGGNSDSRYNSGSYKSTNTQTRSSNTIKSTSSQATRKSTTNSSAQKQGGSLPSRYNKPVKMSDQQAHRSNPNAGKNSGRNSNNKSDEKSRKESKFR